MTCYFRHLGRVFEKAGITVTKENRHEVDVIIHRIVGVTHTDCPAAWREVKKRMMEDEDAFAAKLRDAWKKRA